MYSGKIAVPPGGGGIVLVLMLGVAGACRCDELVHLKINDIGDVKSA
jgi:hypothetical protein